MAAASLPPVLGSPCNAQHTCEPACMQDIAKLEEASGDPQDTAAALLSPALAVQQQNMDQCVRCATVDNFQGRREVSSPSCSYMQAKLVPCALGQAKACCNLPHERVLKPYGQVDQFC